jgi:hypothetical protein
MSRRLGAVLAWLHVGDARTSSGYLALGVFIALAPLLVYLNLNRFLVDSPKVVPGTEEQVALGGLQHEACDGRALIVVREPRPLLNPAIAAYGYDREIETRNYADAAAATDLDSFDCIVVTRMPSAADSATGDETGADANGASLVRRLERRHDFETSGLVRHPRVPFEAVVLTQAHG